MSEAISDDFARFHTLGDAPMPAIVAELAEGARPRFVWRNELGGLTFQVPAGFLKWNPHGNTIDLRRERTRLQWLAGRHPAPQVLGYGEDDDGQWVLTRALPGGFAVGDTWRARPSQAIAAIASGLRALHAVPTEEFPVTWTEESWVSRRPAALGARPPIDDPVLVHGDACAPNTLIDDSGQWQGNVDFGDLAVGDRWADLAVASMSLDWNFGEGHQPEFFAVYGIAPDPPRIAYYRSLWDAES